MKRVLSAAILALSILSYSAPTLSTAQTQGQLAEGRFSFSTADGVTRFVEFSAAGNGEGGASGGMTFNDTSRIPDDDNDGDPPPRPAPGPTEFYIKAAFDTMTVVDNRELKGGVVAVMGGVVRESSHKSYVGRWVQLVVEDNADSRLPDRLSWGLCRVEPGGWVPSDYDREFTDKEIDKGASMSWWATDAERKDDVGIPSRSVIPGQSKGCNLFPARAYDFDYINAAKWEGDIVVRP
ncbi:MAG TPA: hypothetical protein VIP46_07980 [Pyrinomonadaceae bacterium]